MAKQKEKKLLFELNSVWQRLNGNPMRILLLLLTDWIWCYLVPTCLVQMVKIGIPWLECPDEDILDFRLAALVTVTIVAIFKCYHGNILNPGAAINRVEEIRRLTFAVLLSYAAGFLILLFNHRHRLYSPILPILSLTITAVGFPAVRFLIRGIMKKARLGQIRVFIAGGGATARAVISELNSSVYYGYNVIGYFEDSGKKNIGEKAWLGRLCDAPRQSLKYNVHYMICCLPQTALPRVVRNYTRTFEHVLVISANETLPITAVYPTLIGFFGGLEFQNRVLFLLPRFFKRLTEVVMSVCCIVLLLPLFAVLAILVKLSSPGPVFYTAKRLGLNGKTIKVFKFRTMYQGSETQLERLLEECPEMKTEWASKFKLEHDPRVTRIGQLLRRTSLDELPQFINVLRGEMALIGPRPIVAEEVKYYGEAYDFFKRVRPGITGLWQVSGHSCVNYRQRVSMDMFYVMNWSFWLDWYIFWKTIWVVMMRQGSY